MAPNGLEDLTNSLLVVKFSTVPPWLGWWPVVDTVIGLWNSCLEINNTAGKRSLVLLAEPLYEPFRGVPNHSPHAAG